MAKKETTIDIAQAIDARDKDEKRNYRSNKAIARCRATVHSSKLSSNGGEKVFFLTNNEFSSGQFVRDWTGTSESYQSGHANTSNYGGQPVYKNTPLGEVLGKFWRSKHPFKVTNRQGKIINEGTVDIHNKATYNYFAQEIVDLEIAFENDNSSYRYGNLKELLADNTAELKRLEEEKEKMRKLQEEKRKREEEERIAKEKAEEAEKLRLEEERKRQEEEERKRQEEIDRLENSIEETNRRIRSVRNFLHRSVELRSQGLIDEFQDDAKRSHIFDGTAIVIEGGPGTGKTTTIIQRLKFLLSKSALNSYANPLTDAQVDFLTDVHEWNNRWLFFSPTDLLLKYLRNNMAEEQLIAGDNNTRTLERFRSVKMRDYDLFNPAKDGPFKSYRYTETEEILIKDPQKAIQSFEQFCIDFIRGAMEKRVALKTDTYSWHNIAVSIKSTFTHMKVKDIDGLMRMLNALSDRDKSNIKKIDAELRKAINEEAVKIKQPIMENEETVSRINELFEQWKRERIQETVDDEDDVTTAEEEEENAELEAFNKQDFETQLFSTLRKLLRKLALKEIDSKTKLSKRDENFKEIVQSYLTEAVDLKHIGELAWFTKNFSSMCRGLESNLIGQLPKIYKAFRKQLIATNSPVYKQKLLETIVKKDNNKHLHPDEQDLLLGFMNNMFFSIYKKSKNRFAELKHKYVVAYKDSVRPVIGIDEATDFSILDYYLMVSFRHYDFSSITLCGDIMQGLNNNGINSWDELKKFVLPNLEVKPLNISYRQLPTLLEVSKEMYRDDQGEYPSYNSKMEKSDEEPRPSLLISDDENEKARWIANKIINLYENYQTLPSIAIFVGEDVNIRQFIKRIEDQEILDSIDVVDCSGGNIDNKEVVRVFRLSEVKGMEFDAVFFYDIDTAIESSSDKIMRRYLYVGVSRAASHLAATMTTEEGNENIAKYFDQETEGWV